MTVTDPELRESMTTVAEYLREDPRTPDVLFEQAGEDPPLVPFSAERYTSTDWAALEVERVFKKQWQMACRENDIPATGDYIEYRIADQTIVLVRLGDGSIRALRNSCLHRGTALIEGAGSNAEFQCTFHGWTWELDGSLKHIPCRWDFPKIEDRSFALPQVKVDTWNGFVFVNFDPQCEPLADFVGPTLARHFTLWPLDRRYKAVHVVKKINCNWKVALEAFMEDYHVFRTHASIVGYAADCNSQYDIFDGRHSRMITAMGVASPHLRDSYTAQDTVDSMIGDLVADVARDANVVVEPPQIPEGSTSRQVLAGFMRDSMGERSGIDFSAAADAEVLDAIQYQMFPNLIPWGGFSFPLVYRYRPAENPDWCYFDVMILAPMPEGVPLPRDAAPIELPSDEPWANCELLGGLGPVYDQDMVNLPKVQRGLHNDSLRELVFSEYQERNIRHFHRRLEEIVGR
ncbi:aromatic ring-hydroxylating dioxygenase subunit alpha [Sporichthya sp.]|uniref:aromatic ring-hydroxylating oxygenase subunit alpha n=1 Tax=Sporichthya sp. TaxID=65475 RepID=UPI0018178DF0|nr:aromatic ring-hydroxylating dioxygenase subunit alpha [Sporichthya sp.]MBA3743134.1 aromatic ring-hydroxylating dioxygenase subunit alpha [Sporichthya sp.]